MIKSQEEGTIYEAIWFSEDDSNEPVVRGSNVDITVNELLKITEYRNGNIEIYKITYSDLGFKMQLYQKFQVFNKLELSKN